MKNKIWSRMYIKCKNYYNKNGNLDSIEDKSQLTWLKKQRYLYKNNALSQDKIDLLNEIHIDWFPEKKYYIETIDMLKKCDFKSISDLQESLHYQQLKTIISNDKKGFYPEIAESLKELEAGVING